MRKRIYSFLTCILLFVSLSLNVFAEESDTPTYADDYKCFYGADETYEILIDDEAHIITENDEYDIYQYMYQCSLFGNAVFKTVDNTYGMTGLEYMNWYYGYTYGLESNGVVFMIDMDNRKLWVIGYGDCKKTVNDKSGTSITDNVYHYASDENYTYCAEEAFNEIYYALGGGRVTGPLKIFGTGCIAIIFAVVVNFIIAYFMSASRKADDKEILDNIEKKISHKNIRVKFSHKERIYDPPSSSSDSSGGGGSSGGSGGSHGF